MLERTKQYLGLKKINNSQPMETPAATFWLGVLFL